MMRALVFFALTGLAAAEEACASEIDTSSLIQATKLRVQQRGIAQADIKEIAASKESRRAYLDSLLQSTKNLIKEGVTPDVVTFVITTMNAITDQILPILITEHDSDQAILVSLYSAFTKAEDDLAIALANINALYATYSDSVAAHDGCRELESDLCIDANNCDAELALLWVDVVQLESQLSNIDDEIYTEWCEDNQNRTLTTFRTQQVTTFNSYITVKQDLDAAWALYLPKLAECQALRALHYAKVTVCDTMQGTVEIDLCAAAVAVDAVRASYTAAFQQAEAAYNPVVVSIKVEESDRKVEFSTLQMVLCLLENINEMVNGSATAAGTDFVAHLEACQTEIFDTAHLDLVYNDTPAMSPIPDMPLIPCSADYIADAYSEMPFCTEHTDCQQCAPFA